MQFARIVKLCRMIQTLPQRHSLATLEQMLASCPGCEVFEEPGTDHYCQVPAVAKALFSVQHALFCDTARGHRFTAWLCRAHLDDARRGLLNCTGCGNVCVLVEIL